jgi:signal transduction histidine kinase/DNA-binding response OmpR family regulator
MAKAKNHSISRRLTWMNMLVSGAALIMACAAFVAYDMATFRETLVRNLSTQAQIIGSNAVSALVFNDPQSAENTLTALKASPDILSAVIYTPDGQPFASYSRVSGGPIPTRPSISSGETEIHLLSSKEMVLVRSIVFHGKPTGTVYIRSDVEELNQRLKRYAGIAAIVLSVSLIAALLVSAIFRRAVAEPIVHLADIARIVSRDKNYSVRATPIRGMGELTILIDAFNEMLTQIQQSEGALRKAHDELEQRVQERTAELETAKSELEAFSHSILRAKDEVERASKFKDQFLSTMSHELRTPLNAVLGFSDLLADERYGSLNDRQKRYVNNIHTGGQHLLKLISDILDLSKIEAGRMDLAIQEVPIESAFADVLSTLKPLAEKKSQILAQNSGAHLIARADITRLRQMLMNLAGNAIKFTPEGGRIELSAHEASGQIRVEVRDTGPGIPLEEQNQIFQAFYRLRQPGAAIEGTGLGLAITQRLAELHGSTLGLDSQSGQGSCFYFSLPIGAPLRHSQSSEAKARAIVGEAPKIVVIEDDRDAGLLIQANLASAGYETVVCDRPQDAVKMVAEMQPDVITLDLLMKPASGWEILLQLKRDPKTTCIPIIVVSIVDQPAIGTAFGADEYLVKPVDKASLLAAIRRCLGLKLGPPSQRPILVVEDDTATREIIAELLTAQGYAVTTAEDGEQARAKMATALPELVILDLMLPKVSGFELLAEWRSKPRTADLPVFVLTSKDLTGEEEQYLRKHAESLFHKQQSWQQGLSQQLQRVLKVAPAVKS